MATAMCPRCGQYHREGAAHVCPRLPDEATIPGVQQPLPNAYRVPRPEGVRGETHGDYRQMSEVIQATKNVWRCGPSWNKLTPGQKEALELIATKVGRIVCGDPNHLDHWADGAGYFNKGGESCGL